MDARNCAKCGKIFNYIGKPICTNCIKIEEDGFDAIKDYIEENPSCQMKELSDATGVASKKILKYIRDGRLEISKGMSGEVACESCGKPITRGRFCDKCVIEINNTVSELFTDESALKGNLGPKMHTSRKKL